MDKPTTLDECMDGLKDLLKAQDQIEFIRCSKDDLVMYHHGLGQWIMNHWDLWKGGPLLEHMKSLGFIHQDDMSQAIIVEYWNRLNGFPSDIAKDVQEAKEFWGKNEA
jgi:hypothetical protein